MKKTIRRFPVNDYSRHITARTIVFSASGFTIILCIFYANYISNFKSIKEYFLLKPEGRVSNSSNYEIFKRNYRSYNDTRSKYSTLHVGKGESVPNSRVMCPDLVPSKADIDTAKVFQNFDFEPSWLENKHYWDQIFEDRYQEQKRDRERRPLKVIIVPHSHNDPGWQDTFEDCFQNKSWHIINNMLEKLQEYKDLTFIWSEVIFLNAWWEKAYPSQRKALQDLVKAGRIEITTGGWVMIDEANTHIYAMIDQLIEGHQWLHSNLDIKPRYGWSIDPFGHGSTQPYILAQSGFNATIVQRVHYAWKQWLAMKQYGDFRWIPSWSPSSATSTLLTHNHPFALYSIKHSCGPNLDICASFDFSESEGRTVETITAENVKSLSERLLEQYAKTGSLSTHNVVLIPLGDDFRYNTAKNIDEQYTNYIKIIDYVNANKDEYRAEINFGTPSDYFDEIVKRNSQFPSLTGDFFVYADIYTEAKPAYWSGYFTTRPHLKILGRELESSLRSAEILYTIALNYARQNNLLPHLKSLKSHFEQLVRSRRSLGLFQHHDAITGTSKSWVMHDYGLKLFQGIRDTVSIQQSAIQTLLFPNISFKPGHNLVFSDLTRLSYKTLPRKLPITITPKEPRRIILYNSLAYEQEHVIQIRTTTFNVKIFDNDDREVIYQIDPVWKFSESRQKALEFNEEFKLVFIAKIPQLSLVTYNLIFDANTEDNIATIYCNKCGEILETSSSKSNLTTDEIIDIRTKLKIESLPKGDIHFQNNQMELVFSGYTGFLKSITRKHNSKITRCGIQFAAYRDVPFHSGAYLFKPEGNGSENEMDVLEEYRNRMHVIITSGPVMSRIVIIYGSLLIHTVSLYHIENSTLSDGIFIENIVDFEEQPNNKSIELFMRILSDIKNGEPPEFHSDLNGFQMQQRVKIKRINIEGNYYPITSMAFIQDENTRLSIITNHAQGAASWQTGYLEVMLDRRSPYDDLRGLGEGLTDNRRTVHKLWLLIEDIGNADVTESVKRFVSEMNLEKDDVARVFNIPSVNRNKYQRPSLYANRISNLLNYPANIFLVDQSYDDDISRSIQLINKPLDCDVHLITLRTQPDSTHTKYPSSSAFLVLHRQGYDCAVGRQVQCDWMKMSDDTSIQYAEVEYMEAKSLSGVETLDEKLYKLSDITLDPMSLKTVNITFS